MRIYASAASVAPLLNGLDRLVETTTDISGVSTCPLERLILLEVILDAFIVMLYSVTIAKQKPHLISAIQITDKDFYVTEPPE